MSVSCATRGRADGQRDRADHRVGHSMQCSSGSAASVSAQQALHALQVRDRAGALSSLPARHITGLAGRVNIVPTPMRTARVSRLRPVRPVVSPSAASPPVLIIRDDHGHWICGACGRWSACDDRCRATSWRPQPGRPLSRRRHRRGSRGPCSAGATNRPILVFLKHQRSSAKSAAAVARVGQRIMPDHRSPERS